MKGSQKIHIVLENENHPLLSIISAEYEPKIGVQLINSWDFNGNDHDYGNCKYYFRILLNSVFFSEFINNYCCSRCDFEENDVSLFGIVFLNPKSNDKNYHSIGLLTKMHEIPHERSLNKLIFQRIHFIAVKYLNKILDMEDDLDFANLLKKVAMDCIGLFQAGIPIERIKILNSGDASFYNLCLTSHLQSMMTTIIEATSEEECSSLFSLLSHFLLPEQRKLSCKKILKKPIPGLYLQCVKPQSNLFPVILRFDRPWTYIVTSKKKVINFTNIIEQKQIFNIYSSNVFYSLEKNTLEQKQLCAKLMKTYHDRLILPCEWVKDLISSIMNKEELAELICKQKFFELIQRGLILSDVIKESTKMIKLPFLQTNQIDSIMKLMDIKDIIELRVLCSISEIFNEGSFNQLFSGRNETIRKMISSM